MKIIFAGVAVLGAVVALVFHWLERQAQQRERDRARADAEGDRLRSLSTTVVARREHVPRLMELSAYDLGADHEQVASPGDRAYVGRDRDHELREALGAALHGPGPQLIILRGPSKAGKSRTLYEAARSNPELKDAVVLAPRDAAALTALVEGGGLPSLPPGPVLLWLDDLELFVKPGRNGMHPHVLDSLASWGRATIVVATAGGRGAEQLAASNLSVPIQKLYGHPSVVTISLSSELSVPERARVRERYPTRVAEEIFEHGIGEYLVAAPELARKLEEERHKPGDNTCPEGAAVAWAAIDWSRAGMTTPVSREFLAELWRHYLRGLEPSEQRFQRGLDWALLPLYRSIALLEAAGSYRAYDWIVAHADRTVKREIDPAAWDRIIELADSGESFDLGVAAHQRGADDRAERAVRRATEASDPEIAGRALFNLGLLLIARGDLESAEAAWRVGDERGNAESAHNLGVLLQQRGDLEGAEAAWRRAAERGEEQASYALGLLLERRGDLEGAEAAWRRADSAGHPEAAARLGVLLHQGGDVEGARCAFGYAIINLPRLLHQRDDAGAVATNLGLLLHHHGYLEHAEVAYRAGDERGDAEAAFNLGLLLEERGDLQEAEDAFRRGYERGDPQAATSLGVLLDQRGDVEGAKKAFDYALFGLGTLLHPGDAGAAEAAANLGVLLHQHGYFEHAEVAYRAGDERGNAEATFNLGLLLKERGDLQGAEAAWRRGGERGYARATFNLGLLLHERGDLEGAEAAWRRAVAADDEEVAQRAAAALESFGGPPGS